MLIHATRLSKFTAGCAFVVAVTTTLALITKLPEAWALAATYGAAILAVAALACFVLSHGHNNSGRQTIGWRLLGAFLAVLSLEVATGAVSALFFLLAGEFYREKFINTMLAEVDMAILFVVAALMMLAIAIWGLWLSVSALSSMAPDNLRKLLVAAAFLAIAGGGQTALGEASLTGQLVLLWGLVSGISLLMLCLFDQACGPGRALNIKVNGGQLVLEVPQNDGPATAQ